MKPLYYVFEVEVFWAAKLCNFLVGYQSLRGTCCLRFQDNEGSMYLWDSGILTQHYMTSKFRKPRLETSAPRRPQDSLLLQKKLHLNTQQWKLTLHNPWGKKKKKQKFY